jgi:hypothetical protein
MADAAADASQAHALSDFDPPLPLGRMSEPPLRRVSSFLEDPRASSSVAVRLAEPFWSGLAHIELLVHCVQLHSMLEQETVGKNSAPRNLDHICDARPRVQELLEALCADTQDLDYAATSPMPLLDVSGLSAMCPLVAHYLGDPDTVRSALTLLSYAPCACSAPHPLCAWVRCRRCTATSRCQS